MTTNVEEIVIELDNREKIKELRFRYCRALDAKDFDSVEICFTEDAIVDFGPAGKYESREALMSMFNEFGAQNPVVGMHVVTNPIIEFLNAKHATAEWVSSFSGHDASKGSLLRQTGVCFDEYLKTDQGWQIKSCEYKIMFHDSHSSGAGSPMF